jgi:Delta7-sterol 5-desaturase
MFEKSYLLLLLVITLRYLIVAGLAFLVFYVLFRKVFVAKRIQAKFPKNKDYYREIGYSLITSFIFALYGYVLLGTSVRSYTQVYDNISDYGVPYFILSVVIVIFLHDTYFYWTHRLMHHPKLFRTVHLIHHHSTNPSPWASFSFHPIEGFIEAGIILVIVFLMPIHPMAIVSFILFMTVYNVYGHLGYEIFPGWLVRSRAGQWLNTSTNHNMHHKFFKENYGLYFRFWDEIMGTTHPKYQQTLQALVAPETIATREVAVGLTAEPAHG